MDVLARDPYANRRSVPDAPDVRGLHVRLGLVPQVSATREPFLYQPAFHSSVRHLSDTSARRTHTEPKALRARDGRNLYGVEESGGRLLPYFALFSRSFE